MFSSWALCNTNHNHVNSNDENTNDDVVFFLSPIAPAIDRGLGKNNDVDAFAASRAVICNAPW